jgi:hypothetical protein
MMAEWLVAVTATFRLPPDAVPYAMRLAFHRYGLHCARMGGGERQ